MRKIDIHIHSCFDDGKKDMTVGNIIKEAEKKGVEEIGIVIHYHKFLPSAEFKLYGDIDPEECNLKLNQLIKKIRKVENKNVKIGIETEIIDMKGNLNASEEVIEKVDYVLGSCHWFPEDILPIQLTTLIYKDRERGIKYYQSEEWKKMIDKIGREKIIEKCFTMYENVITKYPSIILSHPHLAELAVYKIIDSLEEVKNHLFNLATLMGKKKILFNLTEPMVKLIDNPSIDNSGIKDFWASLPVWINICKEKGVKFIPGSDAHCLEEVGKVDGCYKIIKNVIIS